MESSMKSTESVVKLRHKRRNIEVRVEEDNKQEDKNKMASDMESKHDGFYLKKLVNEPPIVGSYSPMNQRYRQRQSQNLEPLKIPLLSLRGRRQSLPTDTAVLKQHPSIAAENFLSTIDAFSCPGSPQRRSMIFSPILTPAGSVSSLVSSLGDSRTNLNRFEEEEKQEAIFSKINNFLQSLEDADYTKQHTEDACNTMPADISDDPYPYEEQLKSFHKE